MSIDRNTNILKLYNSGLSSSDIALEYGISSRQVQRILFGHIKTGVGLSKDNQLGNLRVIIIALMIEQGRDFNTCELCHCDIPKGKHDIHHTKYEQATFYDLMIVCRRCNTAALNRYLS
jgi:hypothetical protein